MVPLTLLFSLVMGVSLLVSVISGFCVVADDLPAGGPTWWWSVCTGIIFNICLIFLIISIKTPHDVVECDLVPIQTSESDSGIKIQYVDVCGERIDITEISKKFFPENSKVLLTVKDRYSDYLCSSDYRYWCYVEIISDGKKIESFEANLNKSVDMEDAFSSFDRTRRTVMKVEEDEVEDQ
jgi:hypothetical protein